MRVDSFAIHSTFRNIDTLFWEIIELKWHILSVIFDSNEMWMMRPLFLSFALSHLLRFPSSPFASLFFCFDVICARTLKIFATYLQFIHKWIVEFELFKNEWETSDFFSVFSLTFVMNFPAKIIKKFKFWHFPKQLFEMIWFFWKHHEYELCVWKID